MTEQQDKKMSTKSVGRELRGRIGLFGLALFVAVGAVFFGQGLSRVDVEISLDLPPGFKTEQRGVKREEITSVNVMLIDAEGVAVAARASKVLPHRARSPVVGLGPMSLAGGRYLVKASFATADGIEFERTATVFVEVDGPLRIEID